MPPLIVTLEPAVRAIVASALDSLWESILLVVAVALVLRLLRNLSASTRYAAWCVALGGSLVLPLATALPQVHVVRAPLPVTAVSARAAPAVHRVRRVSALPKVPVPVGGNTPAGGALPLARRVAIRLPEYWAFGLFAFWGVVALALIARLFAGLVRLEHLKNDALPLPVEYRDGLGQWSNAQTGGRELRLCVCDGIDVPVAVGLFDSMILIPRHLLDVLAPSEIDQIVLHELGHLRRADDWTNVLQRIIQALLFFNPAVAYIAEQLDLEREVACDDWVLQRTKEVRPYAACLTHMAEVTAWPHRPLAAPGVFLTRRGLSVRVERLLRAGRNVRTGVSIGPASAILAVSTLLFLVLQTVAPSFAFSAPAAPSADDVQAHTPVPTPAATHAPTPAPTPAPRLIVIPSEHVHVPARTVHIPAVNFDTPERRIAIPAMPSPNVRFTFPPNFGARLRAKIDKAFSGAMAQQSAGAITGADYSGQNLTGRSFRGRRLTGADFSNANLQRTDFSRSVLVGIDFSGSDLRGASFAGAVMTGCDLSKTNLQDVDFQGVQMTGCDIDARALLPTQARWVVAGCRTGCDLNHANLEGASLRGVSLTADDLSGADLRGSDLSGSTFTDVDFSNADFTGARVAGTSFVNCGLDDAARALLEARGAKIVEGE
jgi:uncharacterized protein YjbI with pentapeptide repeats/beta-lactamase regulating signal transducer with metallopeptidase domain